MEEKKILKEAKMKGPESSQDRVKNVSTWCHNATGVKATLSPRS